MLQALWQVLLGWWRSLLCWFGGGGMKDGSGMQDPFQMWAGDLKVIESDAYEGKCFASPVRHAVNVGCCQATCVPTGEETWDVFVSHPGALKDTLAAQLKERFEQLYPSLKVFVDDWDLHAGDNATRKMLRACGTARIGESPFVGQAQRIGRAPS
jgi:hypothetical protein